MNATSINLGGIDFIVRRNSVTEWSYITHFVHETEPADEEYFTVRVDVQSDGNYLIRDNFIIAPRVADLQADSPKKALGAVMEITLEAKDLWIEKRRKRETEEIKQLKAVDEMVDFIHEYNKSAIKGALL